MMKRMGGLKRGQIGWSAAFFCVAVISIGIVQSLCAEDSTQPSTVPSTAPTVEATTQISPEVQAIVADFSNDDFSTRQDAQKKLVQMGLAIEPQLQQLLAGDLPEESRARITAAIRQIDEIALLGPSSITMKYQNAPLSEILDDFARQAHADFGLKRPQIIEQIKNRRASIKLDHASFWDALTAVSKISSLHIVQNGGAQMQLENTGGSQNGIFNSLTLYKGAFAITPRSCTESRNIQYGRGGQSANLNLNIEVVAEPKLHVLDSPNFDWLQQCTDDKGNDLMIPNQNQNYGYGNQRWIWPLNAQLKDIADLGSKISVLKGELHFTIATRTDVLEEDDMSKVANITKNINGLNVSIVKFSKEGNQWQLHMQIAGPAGQNTYARLQSIISSMEITDDQGMPLQMQGTSESGNGVQTEATVMFSAMNRPNSNGNAKHFRWEIPVETRTIAVPFELHDLDLPGGGGGL